ncbi:MAG: GlmU family protein [Polaribacter sp.]|jgi:UDP-N-acetylglucosamine diphosphorylase/glucosamine-1-phosphate N-acetyltransferase|tara:strand:+ start:135 stop:1310 length:1176 start_codon:yes stop_codon:yes gene_type:complete
MNYILFDSDVRTALLPFTYTRPVADIRIGILTIREKWEKYLGLTTTTITAAHLEEKHPMVELEENILINASFCPTAALVALVKKLSKNEAVFQGEDVIAFYTTNEQEEVNFDSYTQIEFKEELIHIKNTWDIFTHNGKAIQQDFELVTEDRTSEPIPAGVQVINKENIFIEEGAEILFATLNAAEGPIYIGKNAQIMEGASVRGPFAMGVHSVLKMGAKIYKDTTLGPYCKVGGEVSNAVIFGYSSKGHDGYLGNSVIGEWCNIGAGTSTSNLKNNYAPVKIWDYETGRFAKTGLQFCGLIMGDHSKCAINTMFNTGTVVGVSANIFGGGFPRNFIPSYSWGGAAGFVTFQMSKVYEVVIAVMRRKSLSFEETDQKILDVVFEETRQYRKN